MILPLAIVPSPGLFLPSEPIAATAGVPVAREWKQLGADLRDTMIHHKAYGISAPQVGRNVRLIVVSMRQTTLRHWALFNPTIVLRSDRAEFEKEGCLSVPGSKSNSDGPRVLIRRAVSIVVGFDTAGGQRVVVQCGGLSARIVQHEIDHLDGVVLGFRSAFELKAGIIPGKGLAANRRSSMVSPAG